MIVFNRCRECHASTLLDEVLCPACVATLANGHNSRELDESVGPSPA